MFEDTLEDTLHGVTVIHMDRHIVVADKPAGIPTTPQEAPQYPYSLVTIIRRHNPPHAFEYSPAHSIDAYTTGLVVGGLNRNARGSLCRQFTNRCVEKFYLAKVHGTIEEGAHGTIDKPLEVVNSELPDGRHRMIVFVSPNGLPALTEFWSLANFPAAQGEPESSFMLVRIHTGKTHQIRVHFSSIGHPVVEDPLYGRTPGSGQLLHAAYLGLARHPATKKPIDFVAPPPSWVPDSWRADVQSPEFYSSVLDGKLF